MFRLASRGRSRQTVVTCTGRDAGGDSIAPVTFTVTVRGVHDQIAAVERTVRSTRGLARRARSALLLSLVRADRDYAVRARTAADVQLRAFTKAAGRLPRSLRHDGSVWRAAARRVGAVIG